MSAWRSCSLTSMHLTVRLMSHIKTAGLDFDLALEGSGVTAEMLNDPKCKIKVLSEQHIFRNTLAMLPDTAIAIDIGLSARISAYGLLGYAFLTAPTMRSALAIAAQYPALVANNFDLSVQESDGVGRIIFDNYSGPADLKSAYAELALASFKRTCSDMLAKDLRLIKIGFECKETLDRKKYHYDALGCPTLYEQTNNFLEFPAHLLDGELPFSDPVSHNEILGICSRQNSELAAEREWMAKVRAIIASTLQYPVQLEEVAEQMHCSSRTLRRQLSAYKTSYRQLLDDVRFERAKAMLKEGRMSTDEIAESLGFCDGAGFRRAFQRWSGQPPGSYKT
ncbi:AraC family transcriptional regulator [Pseudomonas aeruginosa]|nr:AraC family transcriptional regulator [Pseudomonas aeruginosa]